MSRPDPIEVTAERVASFVAARQHLDRPLPASRLADAVGSAGLQDSPPGGAGLSLLARTRGLTPAAYDRALWTTRSLAVVWSVRGARYLVRARDVAVFTAGALPASEPAVRAFIGHQGVRAAAAAGMSATDAVSRVAEAVAKSLRGRALSRHHLGGAIKRLLPAALAPFCRPCDARHVNLLMLRAAGLRAGVVHAGSGDGADMTYRLAAEWFPGPRPKVTDAACRAELLRRYLGAYGPATPERFAKWLGVGPAHVRPLWDAAATSLAEVRVAGRPGWMIPGDVAALRAARPPAGVRLLPAFDSYLAADRAVLLPDLRRQREVWRVIDWPGVVLAGGRIAGTWKPRKRGDRLEIALKLFAPLTSAARRELEAAAVATGPWRGATGVRVVTG